MGRYYDLCADDDPVLDKPTRYDLAIHGWDNETSSYKCGKEVGIMMCDSYYDEGAKCKAHERESGMPGTENGEIGLSNKVSFITITHTHPYSATLYSRKGCKGRSAWL